MKVFIFCRITCLHINFLKLYHLYNITEIRFLKLKFSPILFAFIEVFKQNSYMQCRISGYIQKRQLVGFHLINFQFNQVSVGNIFMSNNDLLNDSSVEDHYLLKNYHQDTRLSCNFFVNVLTEEMFILLGNTRGIPQE